MNNIEEIATSFAREYGNDAIYPSHLFKAILHKDIGMVHFIETDLDKDYYYLQEWADVQIIADNFHYELKQFFHDSLSHFAEG